MFRLPLTLVGFRSAPLKALGMIQAFRTLSEMVVIRLQMPGESRND